MSGDQYMKCLKWREEFSEIHFEIMDEAPDLEELCHGTNASM
jgi:hypothetical protein